MGWPSSQRYIDCNSATRVFITPHDKSHGASSFNYPCWRTKTPPTTNYSGIDYTTDTNRADQSSAGWRDLDRWLEDLSDWRCIHDYISRWTIMCLERARLWGWSGRVVALFSQIGHKVRRSSGAGSTCDPGAIAAVFFTSLLYQLGGWPPGYRSEYSADQSEVPLKRSVSKCATGNVGDCEDCEIGKGRR